MRLLQKPTLATFHGCFEDRLITWVRRKPVTGEARLATLPVVCSRSGAFQVTSAWLPQAPPPAVCCLWISVWADRALILELEGEEMYQ